MSGVLVPPDAGDRGQHSEIREFKGGEVAEAPQRGEISRGRPPQSCPDATRAHTRCTGNGAPAPPASWAATPAARAPTAGSPCHEVHPRTRTDDTTGPVGPPGRPGPHDPAPGADPSPPGRVRPDRRTRSRQGQQR